MFLNRLFALSVALVLGFLAGCRQEARGPVVSPDGQLVAVPETTGELLVVIKDQAGTELYHWKTGASTYQWWVVEWKDSQHLLMESADVGAYILERQPDNTWRENTPGGAFSPNGKRKVQTSWDSQVSKKLRIQFFEVSGPRSYSVEGDFQTNFSVEQVSDIARWDGNDHVVVKTLDGEHSWVRGNSRTWVLENP
ncbi:MAG: hypothetical protein ACRC8S_07650 [Fimbriiglobus sp.]